MHDVIEQPKMLLRVVRLLIEQLLADIDLIRKLRLAPLTEHPHRTANRSQCLHHPLQKAGVKLLRSKITLGKLSDLANQAADLLLGFFDRLGADLGLSGCHERFAIGEGLKPWPAQASSIRELDYLSGPR